MAHEYGHALGLGHSGSAQATMAPSGSPGQTSIRSIHADDIAGIQCIYGVASGTKPMITATSANTMTNTLTIYGMNFGGSGVEVWFTPAGVTASNASPPQVIVSGVSSSGGGTVISVTIPVGAGPGDVMINNSGVGNATLSNAFPTDLMGTFGTPPGPHPDITSITPSSIAALIPGISQTITVTGNDLDLTTGMTLDGSPIDSFRWSILDPNTITLDMPQAATLGAHNVGVTDGVVPDQFGVTVVANTAPALEWGNGEPLNNVSRAAGLDMILAGPVGSLQVVRSSPHGPPSFGGYFFDALNRLISPPPQVIPASGWVGLHIGHLPAPALGADWYGKSFLIQPPQPFVGSNDQSINLVP
jgi:hypothetical protein